MKLESSVVIKTQSQEEVFKKIHTGIFLLLPKGVFG
jgi:hypothetical protein